MSVYIYISYAIGYGLRPKGLGFRVLGAFASMCAYPPRDGEVSLYSLLTTNQ